MLSQSRPGLPIDQYLAFGKVLETIESSNLFSNFCKDRSQLDSEVKSPNGKNGTKFEESLEMWEAIFRKCLRGLETIVKICPKHFKALHLLAVCHLKSDRFKDLEKVRRYLWGDEPGFAASSGTVCGNVYEIEPLFGERKTDNLFNGIRRSPKKEFDRAGNFSAHMGKCVRTLVEMASQLKDDGVTVILSEKLGVGSGQVEKFNFGYCFINY